MDLFAETALGSDAVAVSDDQHPDHQLRINRGPPGVAVVIGQLRAQIAQVETLINATQKVIVGNVGVEIECVKQPSLTTRSLTHHRRVLRSEEHTSELQSLMRISYAVFCLKKKNI